MYPTEEITMPVIVDPTIFDYARQGTAVGTHACLRSERLSQDECHIFFPDKFKKLALVVLALEEYSFPPTTKISEKFKLQRIVVSDFPLTWISIPASYREVCQRIAAKYGLMALPYGAAQLYSYTAKYNCVQILFESKPNVLLFIGGQEISKDDFCNEAKAIEQRGDMLYSYGQME